MAKKKPSGGKKKQKTEKKKKSVKYYSAPLRWTFRVGMFAIIAGLAIGMGIGNNLAINVYSISLDNFFTKMTGDNSVTTNEKDWQGVAKEIAGEGAVLLKNENQALPLAGSNTKVNLLGYRAYAPVYGGGGSGEADTKNAVSLVSALKQNGFDVNTAPLDQGIYSTTTNDRVDIPAMIAGNIEVKSEERPLSRFTGKSSFNQLRNFSDTAIISIGRLGGEGFDLTDNFADASPDQPHYLTLSPNEKALLKQASETFEKTILLLNISNVVEISEIQDYADAILFVSAPGTVGFDSIAKIIKGEINPSGRLPDTFVSDVSSAPSQVNFGDFTYDNVSGNGGKYVNYAEGIYVGYKWYETALAEGYYTQQQYDDLVLYPFGYGQSYTTFTAELSSAPSGTVEAHSPLDVVVRVTNTGEVAGKDVVQMYYTAPYTAGGVEKSAVDLIGYAKTDLLEPGASQEVHVLFNMEDLASYDSTEGDGAYILDQGAYNISLRANAHEVIADTTVNLNAKAIYDESNKRESDMVVATNHFQGDDGEGTLKYLSRQNGFANYNETIVEQKTPQASQGVLDYIQNPDGYDPSIDAAVKEEADKLKEGVDYRAEEGYRKKDGDLTMADMKDADYNDPRWKKLISQMSLSEIGELLGTGGWRTGEVKSIDKPSTLDIDGPQGLNDFFHPRAYVSYPTQMTLACTWNDELANRFGQSIADEAHKYGVTGWYAPATNIHRSPFGGRNFEYYSEDPLLSGKMTAGSTAGARSKGLLTYVKHFALNEQETNRSNPLFTYANEQSIRETYLKPFELAVKEGHSNGMMSSMNSIGNRWTGHHHGLLTSVLREEWGFKGVVVTDNTAGSQLIRHKTKAATRAGQDLWLDMAAINFTFDNNYDIYFGQQSVHHLLYSQATSEVLPTHLINWRALLYTLDALLGVGIVVAAYFLVRSFQKYHDKDYKNKGK